MVAKFFDEGGEGNTPLIFTRLNFSTMKNVGKAYGIQYRNDKEIIIYNI